MESEYLKSFESCDATNGSHTQLRQLLILNKAFIKAVEGAVTAGPSRGQYLVSIPGMPKLGRQQGRPQREIIS